MTVPPNSDQAILDIRKLEEYCLDPAHPRGRHKALVFRDALGIGRSDAIWLRRELLAALTKGGATELSADEYGLSWRLDVTLTRQGERAVIRTVWLVRTDENIPRFVTCWVA